MMASGTSAWDVDPVTLWAGAMGDYHRDVDLALFQVAQLTAAEAEAWMKTNAPWKDQTGNARQGLYATPEHVADMLSVVELGHGVYYGLVLEYKNRGQYAIVWPAYDHWGPIMMDRLRYLFS
jgi:hypothetical protein